MLIMTLLVYGVCMRVVVWGRGGGERQTDRLTDRDRERERENE